MATRLQRIIIAAVAAAFFVAVGLAIYAFREANIAVKNAKEARRQQLIAESRALAAQSGEVLNRDQSAALALAVRGWQTASTFEANNAIANSFPYPSAILQGHTDKLRGAEFSLDGQRIVTASSDKTARVWNAASGQLLATLRGHTHFVLSAVFSPDGERVVTASSDKTARVVTASDALSRAVESSILHDPFAMKILREDEKDVLQFANAHPLASIGRLFTAARSRIAEDAMIEHLMSSSLSGDHQGCAGSVH